VKIDPNELQALSKLMDQWLDLPPESRQAWLDSLGPEYADLPVLLQQFDGASPDPFLGTLPKLTTHAEFPAGGPSSLTPGDLVGPYRLERELGRGGMSVVWLATRADGVLKRDVALKLPLLSQHGATLAARFARERDILAALEHPNIARLYDAGVASNGQPYLALEFVEGESIVDYCSRLRLGIAQRLALFLEVLRAVQYAHTRLVVHRDLKPSNILVTREAQIRLLDFGIAKLLTDDQTGLTELTRVGNQPLTPGYASPEQISGDIVTTASDVYSLGVLLYQLLSGNRPYRLKSDTRRELEQAILEADVAPPSQVAGARALRGDLDTIVLKALQKQPLMRYASADAFAQDVERYLRGEAVLAKPQGAWYHLRKFARRNRIAAASTAAVVIALSIGLGLAEVQKRRAETEAATSKALSDFLQHDLLAQASVREQSAANKRPNPDLKVRDALDRAAAAVAGRFDSQPPVEASIRETIGNAYRDLGLWAESVPQLERAVALRRRTLGPSHIDTLRGMSELGMVYNYMARYAAADTLFTEVYDTRRRLFGKEHPETIAAMNDLMITITRLGNYERAAATLAELLEVQRRVVGEHDTATIVIMHNLGTAYVNLSQFAKAEQTYLKVLELKRHAFGPEHPSTLATLNGLGSVYRSEGKYEQSAQALSSALEIRRRVLGERHPDTLDSMSSLGLLYEARNDYARAEPLLNQVLETRREVLGPEHSTTLVSVNNLAELYRRQGNHAQAESLFTQLVDTRRRVLGPEHPSTLQTLVSLGGIKLADQRYKDAESLLQSACAAFEKTHSDSWQRYYAQSLLGAALSAQQRYTDAAPLLASGYAGLVRHQDSIPVDNRSIVADAWNRLPSCPTLTANAGNPESPACRPPTAR
jgi:serine/threonine protein kinase